MEERRAAELADLAHELAESTNLVTQQARRFRSGSEDDQSSGESDREGGEEDIQDEEEDEELVKGKLVRLERVRDGLREAIRRGREERIAKQARLHDYRFKLEQLSAQDAEDYDVAPLAPSPKSSLPRTLALMVLFGAAVLLALWMLQHQEAYSERLLSLRYLYPT